MLPVSSSATDRMQASIESSCLACSQYGAADRRCNAPLTGTRLLGQSILPLPGQHFCTHVSRNADFKSGPAVPARFPATAVPANLLHDLSRILSPGQLLYNMVNDGGFVPSRLALSSTPQGRDVPGELPQGYRDVSSSFCVHRLQWLPARFAGFRRGKDGCRRCDR